MSQLSKQVTMAKPANKTQSELIRAALMRRIAFLRSQQCPNKQPRILNLLPMT